MSGTLIVIVFGFLGFYFSIILYCDYRATKNCNKLYNETQIINEKQCVEFYMSFILTILIKQPIDYVVYLVDVTWINKIKILTCASLFLSAYGWFKYTSYMKKTFQELYYELRSTAAIVTQEIWSAAKQSTIAVWNALSIIKIIQFAFLLLLLLSVPDILDHLRKGLIKFAKL